MFKLLKNTSTSEVEVTVSNRTVLRILGLVVATMLFLAALQQARSALILVFTAFFLALALNGPVHYIARNLPGKMRGKRAIATALSYFMILLILGAFIASMVPPLIKQTESFINTAPGLIEDARDDESQLGSMIRRYHLEGQLDSFSDQLGRRLENAGGSLLASASRIGSSVFSIVTVLALTFMMLIEGPRIIAFARELLSPKRRADADRLAPEMYRVVKGYVNGQVTLAAIAAAAMAIPLLVLQIDYPIAMVVVVFICGLIPMVGHFIGAAIVTLVAVATSPLAAISILAYYILYQQIENYVVQPRIQANSTNMSPLLVFVSVVIGVSFGGLFGGLFAIPLAGCIRIFILDYLKNNHYIGDKPRVQAAAAKAGAK
ncbi:MAG TPA: AI-2E family transporter [Candidatus Limnocylindrales bacterium]|nr:AI-2E family transporter [Candidatus Limnocylindrales bacterium]